MKSGANNSDQIRIRKMAEEGSTAKEISVALQINQEIVEAFMPKKARKKKTDQVESD